MRRSLIVLAILAIALILYFFIMKTGPEPAPSGGQLTEALSRAQATPREAVLEARVLVPAGEWGRETAPGELKRLALDLYPNQEAENQSIAGGLLTGWWTGEGQASNSVAAYVLKDETRELELSFSRKDTDQHGYLFAKATLKEPQLLPAWEQHWRQVFRSRGLEARYATLVIGTIEGRPTYNEQELLMRNLLQGLAVQDPWGIRDAGWASWGGYSPLLGAALADARGEPVNVQAALRYHHLDRCTYLYLGSPLIYREF